MEVELCTVLISVLDGEWLTSDSGSLQPRKELLVHTGEEGLVGQLQHNDRGT
jgi:hypothetical protein